MADTSTRYQSYVNPLVERYASRDMSWIFSPQYKFQNWRRLWEALAEAEALIAAGCVGHNQLRFYPDAMSVALELGDPDGVERYAAALEDFTKPEPLGMADFFIGRGRVLAQHARGHAGPALTCELQRVRDEALRMGFIAALPAIEAALAA